MFGEVPIAVIAVELDRSLVVAFFIDFCLGNAEYVWFAGVDVAVEGFFVEDGPDAVDVPGSDDYFGRRGSVSKGPAVDTGFMFSDRFHQILLKYFGSGLGDLGGLYLFVLVDRGF